MYRLRDILMSAVLLGGISICTNAYSGGTSSDDSDISYRYLELGYVNIDIDDVLPGINADGEGGGIRFSIPVHPNVHLFAGYTDVNFDFDVDVTTWTAGVGYNYSVADKTDIVARVGYADGKERSGGVSVDDNGYALGIGLRHMLVSDYIRASVLDGIELQGHVDYVDFDDFGDDTTLTAGALFHFNPVIAVGIEGTWGSDSSGYVAGVRLKF